MNIKAIRKRIDEQVQESAAAYHLAVNRLEYNTNVFKPDSPKLEIVVSVDIGRKNPPMQSVTAVRYFYSPKRYNYPRAEDLKKDIEQYLNDHALKPLA